jgi:hypothetical protein
MDEVTADPETDHDRHQEQQRVVKENQAILLMRDESIGDVVAFDPDFEKAAGVSKSSGEKSGKPVAALEHFSDASTPIPSPVAEVVRQVFTVKGETQ